MSSILFPQSQYCPQFPESESASPGVIRGVREEELRTFLETAICLVADPGTVTRNAMRKFLIDSGMMQNFCLPAPSFAVAKELLDQFKPKILVLEADDDPEGFIELLKMHREHFKDYQDSIVVILYSGDLSELTAGAVKEGCDLFLRKPYSLEKFKYRLSLVMAAKTEGSAVLANYREAQKLLESGQQDAAVFKYKQISQNFPECPKALYELARFYLSKQRWLEAERWVWRLREERLLDPEWIPDVIEMAYKIDRFDYIEWLADEVREMPKSKVRIISSVAHGITLLAARLASEGQERGRALTLFQKAVSVSKHATETYTEVIQAMYGAEMLVEADILLRSAPEEVRESEDTKMLLLDYLDQNREAPEVINAAYKLYREGVRRPRVYLILIQRSKELGRMKQIIDELIDEGARVHPDWADTFKTYS